MGTFILKGTAVAGTLSDNTIGNAHFVRIVATAGTNTITVKDGSTTLGTTLLHSAGDEITIEKQDIHSMDRVSKSATKAGRMARVIRMIRLIRIIKLYK